MDNKLIEQAAKSELTDSLMDAGIFEIHISENDKEPSWDGFIYIHQTKNQTKDNIVGRVAVQLKGHQTSDLDKKEISFPLEITDLRNYLKDNGIILFVVYINKNNKRDRKVYFETLTPVKLNKILESTTNTTSITIKLKELPSDSKMQEVIFRNFLVDSRKQISHIQNRNIINIDDIKGKTFNIFTHIPIGTQKNARNFYNILNDYDIYLYLQDEYQNLIPTNIFTSSEYRFGVIEYGEDCPISVNGKTYYNRFQRTFFDNKTILKIGACFEIILSEGELNASINFKLSPALKENIIGLSFFIDALKNQNTFFIKDYKFSFSVFNDILSELENKLYHFNRLDLLFTTLNIVDDLDLDKLTHEDEFYLSILDKAILNKDTVNVSIDDSEELCLVRIKVINIEILLIAYKETDEKYMLQDFFYSDVCAIQESKDGKKILASPFSLLSKDDYINVANMNFEVIFNSYKTLSKYDYIYQIATMDMLRMLLAYDIKSNSRLFKLIKDLSNWILENSKGKLPIEVASLNYLQIIKREREFDEEEKSKLVELADNPNLEVKLGANILLGDTTRSHYYFNKLNEQTQTFFKTYPIYRFYK